MDEPQQNVTQVSDEPQQPAAEWLTSQQAAQRLGLRFARTAARSPSPYGPPDAPALADAVRVAVAPLKAALEREQAATERERFDRRTLQGQADALRVELAAAQIERAQATGEAATERAKREAAETRVAHLQCQLEALEARQRRRWSWF